MSLYRDNGERKYLNLSERCRFIEATLATTQGYEQTLCLTIAYTGCRISEALELTNTSPHPVPGIIVFRTLKRRNQLVMREVPVPASLIKTVQEVHEINGADICRPDTQTPLWPFGRTTAWGIVKEVMAKAQIAGFHATPRGLRHAFAINAIQSGIPLNLVQKWLGHASINTTAIYTNLVGPEEMAMASRMW